MAEAAQKGVPLVSGEPVMKSRAEYCEELRRWMLQVHHVRCMEAMFPAWLSQQLASQNATTSQSTQQRQQQQATAQQPTQPQPQQRGVEFHVPPIWKRVMAEFIDFVILTVIKFALTFIAIDQFQIIDISKYDVDGLMQLARGERSLLDYDLAVEMTSEVLMLELINRVTVCWFEALFLHRGRGGGGSTPGKLAMGLRVVRCDWAVPSPAGHVVVSPAGDLGWGRSFLRSLVKNASISVFFPICVSVLYMDHGRAPYDILGGAIVVENSRR